MMLIRTLTALAALAVLPACIVPIPVPGGTPGAFEIILDEGDSCGARGLQDFVGQSEAAVRGTTFQSPGPVRVIGPGDAVTEEFKPQRVNFRIDAAGKIAAVDCG